MRCSHCHNIIQDSDCYCSMCGTKIVRCPSCQGVVREGSRYCLYCGKPLNGTYENDIPVETEEVADEVFKDKKKVNWIIVLVSVALLIGCTSMAFQYIYNGPALDIATSPQDDQEGIVSNITVGKQQLFSTVTGNVNIQGNALSTDDYVYICDENNHLVRMDHKLENKEVIIDEVCTYVQISDQKIYYVNKNQSLCVSDLDGKNRDVILDKDVYYVIYKDDMIYYQLDEDKESIYSYNIQSKEHEKLNDQRSYNINVCDDVIYYTSEDGIYKMNKDGSQNKKLLDMQVNNLIYHDNALYFLDSRKQILKHDLHTNQTSVLITGSTMYFNVTKDYIFYIDENTYVCSYDLKTEDVKRIYSGYVNGMAVLDGCIIVDALSYDKQFKVAIDYSGINQMRLFIENDDNFI